MSVYIYQNNTYSGSKIRIYYRDTTTQYLAFIVRNK